MCVVGRDDADVHQLIRRTAGFQRNDRWRDKTNAEMQKEKGLEEKKANGFVGSSIKGREHSFPTGQDVSHR
jgi:hypothetical protein